MIAVTGLLVTALVLVSKCAYDRKIRRIDSEAMRLGAEDVARRIVDTRNSIREIRELYEETALCAARSFAKLIASEPSLVEDKDRYRALLDIIGVDEIHISDEKGVLIASIPESYLGYNMADSTQSRDFLPALTNRAFELVQRPMPRGIDHGLFQYAGVARLDRPGIVQIGIAPSRLEQATKIADVAKIAATSRIGRGGQVSIVPLARGDRADTRNVVCGVKDTDKGRVSLLQSDCEGFRIVITMPYRGWRMSDDTPFHWLIGVCASLGLLLLVVALFAVGRSGFGTMLDDLKTLFTTVKTGGRTLRIGPVLVVSVFIFIAGIAITSVISYESYLKYNRSRINTSLDEFKEDFDYIVDDSLFFSANAIASRFPSPKAFKGVDLKKLIVQYNLDELNVVDKDGVMVATTMNAPGAIGQNQWTRKGPRGFCEALLTGKMTYYSQPFRESSSEKGVVRMYAGVTFPKAKGYIQVGFDEKRIASGYDYGLESIGQRWSVGESGYFVLARNTGEIVSCGRPEWREVHDRGELMTLAGIGFDVTQLPKEDAEFQFFEAMLFGERCLCASKKVGNYHRAICAVPLSEIAETRDSIVLYVGSLLFFVLASACVFGTRLFNLVSQLRNFIAEDKKRRKMDLAMAKTIQISSLPVIFPDTEKFALTASMHTAREVGGDFYDFYTVPSGRIFFMVADTSGKGIPAAMFMMKAKAMIKGAASLENDFAAAAKMANDRLSQNNDANMFVTAWMGAFDKETGEIEYVNAGHNPPLVKAADGSVRWIRSRPGLAFAAVEGVEYRVGKLKLERGETLFAYTDGVTEALNGKGEFFGEKQLEKTLASSSASNLIASVEDALAKFVNGAEQADDITMLTLTRK